MADNTSDSVPVSVLPSGKPADSVADLPPKPSSASHSASSRRGPPKQKGPIVALQNMIAASPSRADAFLSHLFRCMQSRAGADAVLMFLCYSSRLAGSVLEILSRAALKISSRQLVATLFKLPPATTVVMASATTPPHIAQIMQLAARFKSYSGMLSEMRCMGRLWGLLGLYFAAKKLVVKARAGSTNEKNSEAAAEATFDTVVASAQIISLIVFQTAENAAYLASRNVLPIKPATQGRLLLLSVRFWGMYVFMEFGRLLVERSRAQASGLAIKEAGWSAKWKKSFLRNASWAPLTVHWGLPNGPLPDVLISFLGAYPATSQMLDLWRDTA